MLATSPLAWWGPWGRFSMERKTDGAPSGYPRGVETFPKLTLSHWIPQTSEDASVPCAYIKEISVQNLIGSVAHSDADASVFRTRPCIKCQKGGVRGIVKCINRVCGMHACKTEGKQSRLQAKVAGRKVHLESWLQLIPLYVFRSILGGCASTAPISAWCHFVAAVVR